MNGLQNNKSNCSVTVAYAAAQSGPLLLLVVMSSGVVAAAVMAPVAVLVVVLVMSVVAAVSDYGRNHWTGSYLASCPHHPPDGIAMKIKTIRLQKQTEYMETSKNKRFYSNHCTDWSEKQCFPADSRSLSTQSHTSPPMLLRVVLF